MLEIRFIKISSVILYLLPLALLTGPFIPDLLVSIISIIFIFFSISKKKYIYFSNKYFFILASFNVYIILRSIFSDNPSLSFESSLFYFRFTIFSLAIWYLIDNNKFLIKNFSIFLLLTFLVALFDGYFQFLNSSNIFGYSSPGVRMTLLLNDNALLGGYLARLFPFLLAISILSFNLNRYKIIFLFSLFILTDVLIFITGERTALGLLFLSTAFILIFVTKYKYLRLITFTISILIMIIISLSNSNIRERNIDYTLSQIGISENSEKIYLFSARHQSHIIGAWNMFIDNPLFGQGPKLFRYLCDKDEFNHNEDTCSTHPHNSYAQLLAETGIIGIIFLCTFLFYIFFKIVLHISSYYRKDTNRLSDYQICLLACFLITLWPILPSQNFFNNWISIIYYLPIGFYLQSLNTGYNKK